MADLQSLMAKHKNLSEEEQKKAGQAIAGKMQPQHYDFLKLVTKLIKEGSIDVYKPETFLNRAPYDALTPEARAKVDVVSLNMAGQLRRISDFYLSKQTPDESPQLETMINHLFLMKERVENQYGDVYKF